MLSHEEVKKQAHELVHEFFECAFDWRELEKRADKLGEENNAAKIVNDVLAETGAGEMLCTYRYLMEQQAVAVSDAEAYCRANGLSVEKLKTQDIGFGENVGERILYQQTDERPDGPYSLPLAYTTLILRRNDKGEIEIEPTEYTRKYLAN